MNHRGGWSFSRLTHLSSRYCKGALLPQGEKGANAQRFFVAVTATASRRRPVSRQFSIKTGSSENQFDGVKTRLVRLMLFLFCFT
jgi:hypothetical protein